MLGRRLQYTVYDGKKGCNGMERRLQMLGKRLQCDEKRMHNAEKKVAIR